jgi:hypothetical protein
VWTTGAKSSHGILARTDSEKAARDLRGGECEGGTVGAGEGGERRSTLMGVGGAACGRANGKGEGSRVQGVRGGHREGGARLAEYTAGEGVRTGGGGEEVSASPGVEQIGFVGEQDARLGLRRRGDGRGGVRRGKGGRGELEGRGKASGGWGGEAQVVGRRLHVCVVRHPLSSQFAHLIARPHLILAQQWPYSPLRTDAILPYFLFT